MEEMIDDTLEMDDDEELEEEADAEVDKVLFALTNGKLGEAPAVSNVTPVRRPMPFHMWRTLISFRRQRKTRL